MIGLILIYLHIFVVVAVVMFTRQLVYIYAHIYGPDAVRGGAMMTLLTGNPLLPSFFLVVYFVLEGSRDKGTDLLKKARGWFDYMQSFKSHQYIYI